MSLPRRPLALLAMLLALPQAQAWGPLGHATVAALAQARLKPAVEAEVERLLAPEHTRELGDVASWPDQIQDDPSLAALWKQTRGEHYVNFHGGPDCDYVPPRDCGKDNCVIGGLQHYVAILGDRKQDDAARLEALKFVVHFVGDIHQPLHGGYRDDLGGNRYQVQFQGKGSNLHKVWDSGLLSTRHLKREAYVAMLQAEPAVTLPEPIAPLDNPYAQWAEQSCRLTAQPGFYPDGHKIDPTYVKAQLPLAERQLRIAGVRLADLLNRTLQ